MREGWRTMLERATDRQMDRLVDLLVENATVVLSGTKIAAQLKVPHSTLGEWMERLRDAGVEARGFPGSGYQLVKLPDILTPRAIRLKLGARTQPGAVASAFASAFGCRIHHFYSTGSTMTEAGKLAGLSATGTATKGAPEGTLVVAEEQTAGRGRLGRRWISVRGAGLYFTLVLRPPLAPADAPVLTLMAGVSLAEAIQPFVSQPGLQPVDLRWPNDVLIGEKKCAGILIEMRAEPERIEHVLVGIGINVNQARLPADLETEATSLAIEARHAISRLDLLISILKRLEQNYNSLLTQGAAAILERFAAISSYASGKRVRVGEGERFITGTTAGLTPEGILLLRRDDGTPEGKLEKIVAGHVRPA